MTVTNGNEVATHEMRSIAILDSLSLEEECAIGPTREWPQSLQETAAFMMSMAHPAAMFVGQDLVVIHNEAWEDVLGGALKQGKPQTSILSEEVINGLKSTMDGKVARCFTTGDFKKQERAEIEHCAVLQSPIAFDHLKAVMVQVLYDRKQAKRSSDPERDSQNEHMSLDRQPFFQKFAEMLPTGLAILDHDAEALFVNQHFHELTVHGGMDKSFKKWPRTIHPDDYDRVMDGYREAFESRKNFSTEFRAHGMNNPWRLFLMRPLGENNLQQASLRKYGGFICAVIDITDIKAAELSQKKAAREAQERKQQQERFIDMISHEIRNPLSAVLHCAEDILEAVQYGKAPSDHVPVDDIVEACDTISLCVSHQKTLVDDVLSFSKLDASMLALVPRNTRPKWQMSESLKIFQPELRKRQIQFDYKVDPTYTDCDVKWVMADLVRISQVLVNLMTNAIKFTANKDGEKKISVDVGASVERPTSYPPDVVFFEVEEKSHRMDSTHGSEWGNGESLYILVAIRDTGIGINSENQAKLFDRFRQATPKTEEMYGGSGLGLNISRKITQLHGGEIGVSSKEGAGSTFGFFFRVRRSENPSEEAGMQPDELRDSLVVPKDVKRGPADDKDTPESLKSLRVEATSNNDNRWQNTAQIVNDMSQDGMPQRGAPKQDTKADKKDNSGEAKLKNKAEGAKDQEGGQDTKDTGDWKVGATEDPGEEPKKSRSVQPKPQKAAKPYNPEALKILFVEDNLINQKILKRKIESKGFNVMIANNGKEAVESFKAASEQGANSRAFDCVLMDQEMPVMDGNAATRAIRRFEEENSLSRVHIIGVTANVREEQQNEMKTAGMDSVLSKPFKIDELVARINSMTKTEGKD